MVERGQVLLQLGEAADAHQGRGHARITQHRLAGDTFAVSDLVRMEARIMPVRLGDAALLAAFDAFFATVDVRVLSLTAAVCDRATILRATHNFKAPDALQLAAIAHGCNRFLTGDGRLSRCTDIPVDVLP